MAEKPWGVRMPAGLYLDLFGRVVREAFGVSPILVGSALRSKTPADIDVRLVLPDVEYMRLIGPVVEFGKVGTRWAALSMAFSALGTHMTGKPIDFQIQFTAVDLSYKDEPRIALATAPGRAGEVE